MVKLGDQLQKAYVCLHTCPASRAVNLELTGGLDLPNFLRCFRRFFARRGLPKVLISDNAQTFPCADKDIRKIDRSEAVQTNLANKGVNWKFIIPRSPNYGGYWERLIGRVKNNLKKVIRELIWLMMSYLRVSLKLKVSLIQDHFVRRLEKFTVWQGRCRRQRGWHFFIVKDNGVSRFFQSNKTGFSLFCENRTKF